MKVRESHGSHQSQRGTLTQKRPGWAAGGEIEAKLGDIFAFVLNLKGIFTQLIEVLGSMMAAEEKFSIRQAYPNVGLGSAGIATILRGQGS